ncbi:hypothetical protein [Kamptonema sp. UHCC 0994]|uniref:hypothetical protein n=1 Tax=Kamptonema sp. UHCC 0994 TaxID=3031329 RepID=UPI0023B9746A|nr:hypothetical protein [Kamptonema sp. UHCC 0994]MDF0552739.1 hypothetical protein [Kamptonema sp. UHCC 0994]
MFAPIATAKVMRTFLIAETITKQRLQLTFTLLEAVAITPAFYLQPSAIPHPWQKPRTAKYYKSDSISWEMGF